MTQSNTLLTQITDATFDSLVLAPKHPAIVIVSAARSEQHKQMKSSIKNCAESYEKEVKTFYIDVASNTMLMGHEPMSALPLFLVINDGHIIKKQAGVISTPQLMGLFEAAIGKPQ